MTPFRRSCRREHPGGEARGDALTPGRLFSFVFVSFLREEEARQPVGERKHRFSPPGSWVLESPRSNTGLMAPGAGPPGPATVQAFLASWGLRPGAEGSRTRAPWAGPPWGRRTGAMPFGTDCNGPSSPANHPLSLPACSDSLPVAWRPQRTGSPPWVGRRLFQ